MTDVLAALCGRQRIAGLYDPRKHLMPSVIRQLDIGAAFVLGIVVTNDQPLFDQPRNPSQPRRLGDSCGDACARYAHALSQRLAEEHIHHDIPRRIGKEPGGKAGATGILRFQIGPDPLAQLSKFFDLLSSAIPITIAARHGTAHTVLTA